MFRPRGLSSTSKSMAGSSSSSLAPPPPPPFSSSSSSSLRIVKLEREAELRIEVGSVNSLKLRLVIGNAEIFGTELCPDSWIEFRPGTKFAVFTWYGATIELDGLTETEYSADETPMISYVNVHMILEGRRSIVKAYLDDNPPGSSSSSSSSSSYSQVQGPRVIVVGPPDCGKNTLSSMLLNWASKMGRTPIYVDLDVGQGSITIPGCIAAIPIEGPILDSLLLKDNNKNLPYELSLVYYFGHICPSVNAELYKILMKELSKILEKGFANSVEYRTSGMVINTMGWIEDDGYELLLYAIDTFNATVVLVLDQEKLCNILRDHMLKNKPNVDVVKLQKSGGVVYKDDHFRRTARDFKLREYYYGLDSELAPQSKTAKFSEFYVYRIGGGPAPRSTSTSKPDPTRLIAVNFSSDLLFQVLAVSLANDPSQIVTSNVAGYIYITEVDLLRRKITFLAPSDARIPSKYLIVGSLMLNPLHY